MTIDPVVAAMMTGPTVAALVWLGVMSNRISRTEKDVAKYAEAAHDRYNKLTVLLTEMQLDMARLIAIDEKRHS